MRKILLAFLGFVLSYSFGQNITKKDYKRAISFMYNNYNNKTVFNLHTTPNWFKDKSGLWFIEYSKDNKVYKKVLFKDQEVKDLFDHVKLAKALSDITKKEVKPNDILVSSAEPTENGNMTIISNGKKYALNLESYKLLEVEEDKEENNPFETKSPDGKWIAFTKDYNLFIKSTETNEKIQLSTKGEREYQYASWYGWYDKMEGENGERQKRFYVNWSEDSKWIATSIVDTQIAEKMYLLDWSIDSLYKPKLLSYYRGSPGDTAMVKIAPVFYNIETKKEVKTNLPTGTHINSVDIEWSKDSGVLLANYSERGYQKEIMKVVDLNKRTEKTLIELSSKTNIDNFWYRYLSDLGKVIYLSEESGWRQLYMVDVYSGNKQILTNGDYYIARIEHVDQKNKVIYFLANGKEQGNNPYHHQLYKIGFNGSITLLTPELVNHHITFSEDGNYFVDNMSTVETPTKTVLRNSNSGKIITELTTADISNFTSKGWNAPEPFSLIAKDGKTTIYGALWKPTNFDSNKSYPIIDATYTGPHTNMFPESFTQAFGNQSLAEFGFIVIRVDGLGTAGRSKAFHNHSYKNMGNNLEDHVLVIKELAKQYNWIDIERVGIYGHSAGGYDTGRALLAFPDFYKVGVASSADHDFRMEKAWWPEMYQGWPVDSTYHEVSNITNAKNLKGKLLITHGGLDDNVNPSASFKLAEALIKADKDFDLVIFPSQRHGYTGQHRLYFIKKRWNYFIEHLLGEKPIWDFKWD